MSGETEPEHTELHRYFEDFLHGFEKGLGKGYTRIGSELVLYSSRYSIEELIHGVRGNTISVYMPVVHMKDGYEILLGVNLKLATKIESWYEVLTINRYGYRCTTNSCEKLVKTTLNSNPFELGYALGSEFREMIRDFRRASSIDERLKWVLGIEVLRILMINDIVMDRNSPLTKIAEGIDKLYNQISKEDMAIFENYMAMLGSAGIYHNIASYNLILNIKDPSRYGMSLLKHLIEKGEIRLRKDGIYVKGRKIEPIEFGENGVSLDGHHWRRIYARYVWLHIRHRYYGKILEELAERGYNLVDAGGVILLAILNSKADTEWNPADEVLRFSFIRIRGRDGRQVDLIEEIVRRRPELASMIINKVVESESLSPLTIEFLMRKIGNYISDKEKIAMLNKLFIKTLNIITSDSRVSRDKIPWFSIVSIVAKSIPRLGSAIYSTSGWKTLVLMRDGGRLCTPLYLESRGGGIGGIFGFYYHDDDDYGDVLVPIKLSDIDSISGMNRQDIERIWVKMKRLLIDPQASALVELVELREGIKIPIIDMFNTTIVLSSDTVESVRRLAKNLPIFVYKG